MSPSGFLKIIVPPHDTKKDVTVWRWIVVICVVVLLGNATAGRGGLRGYGAYAAAQDVQIILELQYAETIRNLHLQICTIRPNRNATLENALEDYQRRYDELAGQRYPLPDCHKHGKDNG